jgi:hypothetical protein
MTTTPPSRAALRLIASTFPGAMSVRTQPTPPAEQTPIWLYLDYLYGRAHGYAYCCVGTGPHLQHGTYRHAGWHQHFVPWPHQAGNLIELIRTWASVGDVYLAPVLRVHRNGATLFRGQPNLTTTPWCWTDVDKPWNPDQQATWKSIIERQVMEVDTGRGRHCYVRLNLPQPTDRTEDLNRRLANRLAGEKWSAASLLRPPGSFNWKPWAKHGRNPFPVRRVR